MHLLPATRERAFAYSFFVRSSIFLFSLPYYHLILHSDRLLFALLFLLPHLSLFHLGFINNFWYNSFGRRCLSYCAPDVLCNWQVMFFHFTHQEFYYLFTGKPLRNPATMAGFSGYKKLLQKTIIVSFTATDLVRMLITDSTADDHIL